MLFGKLEGRRVLEVGIGTGKNIPYYPDEAVVTAIDISTAMIERARRRAATLGRTVDIRRMDIEHPAFPANDFDTAVATFLFCSVPDPLAGLHQLRRVLKPGGKLYLLEHIRPANAVAGALFDLLNPLMVRLSGANINRTTVGNVRMAGFRIIRNRNLLAGVFREIIAAVPASSRRRGSEDRTSEPELVGIENTVPEYARAGAWCRGPAGTGIPLSVKKGRRKGEGAGSRSRQ
jgi:SAM-dependent methyltransferase